MSQADRLRANTLVGYLGFGWRLGISFFLIAIIVDGIGKRQYGIYVLLETMVSFCSLLDITGVEGSFVKFLAQFHAAGQREKFNQMLGLGCGYYTFFQLVLCGLILLFHQPLLRLFSFSGAVDNELLFVLQGFLFISFIRGSGRVFRSALIGIQRLDIANLIDIILTLPTVVGTIFVLRQGYGLSGLVLVGSAVAVLTVTGHWLMIQRLVPGSKPTLFDRDLVGEAMGFGIRIQLIRIAELINQHLDKLLLGLLLPDKTLIASYELGAKPARALRDLPSQLLPAILPAASSLDARGRRQDLDQLYARGSKYLLLITLPLLCFAELYARPLITLWLPTADDSIIQAFRILALGYGCTVLTGMGRLIARGMGIPQFETRASMVVTMANLMLSLLLIPIWGLTGALIGSAMAALLGALRFMTRFHRHLGTSFRQEILLPLYPKPLLAAFCGALGSLLLHAILPEALRTVGQRGPVLLQYGLLFTVFMALYLIVVMASGILDQRDRQFLSRCLQLLRRPRMEAGQ